MYITHYSDAQRVIATTAAGALQRSEMYQHCGPLTYVVTVLPGACGQSPAVHVGQRATGSPAASHCPYIWSTCCKL